MTERNHVVLTLPAWAIHMAGDLVSGSASSRMPQDMQAEQLSFRFEEDDFDRLDLAAGLIARRLPFDLRRQQMEGGRCLSSERKVRFDPDGMLEVDIEDLPAEMGNVYIGLLETAQTFGERTAVNEFLQAARQRSVVEPLGEVGPLPEQVAMIREAEEACENDVVLRGRRGVRGGT